MKREINLDMQWLKSSGGGKSLSAEEGWKEKVKAQLMDLMLWTQQYRVKQFHGFFHKLLDLLLKQYWLYLSQSRQFSFFVVWQKSYYLHFFKNIDCCIIDNKLDLDLDLVEEAKIKVFKGIFTWRIQPLLLKLIPSTVLSEWVIANTWMWRRGRRSILPSSSPASYLGMWWRSSEWSNEPKIWYLSKEKNIVNYPFKVQWNLWMINVLI